MPSIPPGQYTLVVEASGFKKATQPAFRLEVQQQATFNVELSLGDVSATVEVTASAPLLNTTISTLGQVVENRFIISAPLSNRSPLDLVALAPGIVNAGDGVNFVANGARNSSSDVMMDGSIITGIEQNGGVTQVKFEPTVDVVEEFKIQTNFFNAEFGSTGGAIINIVSKSGTNQVHGVGYEFRRDSVWNANDYFSNAQGGKLTDSHRDIFGYAIGGPVYLPRVYNGKNKTFFFTDFEGQRNAGAASTTSTVPTADQLKGDFSDLRLSNGNLVPIYNPFSTYTDANGNTRRLPFDGNVIPPSMFDPIAKNILPYFPAATSSGNQYTHARNWFAQGTSHSSGNKVDAKVDHNISEKQRFTVRYGASWGLDNPALLVGNAADSANIDASRNQNAVIDYTRTHSATTVITARASFTRAHEHKGPASEGFDQTSLGLPSIMLFNGVKAFPRIGASGYRSLGVSDWSYIHRDETVAVLSSSVTKVHNAHTIKAGVETRRLYENYYQPPTAQGSFSFGRGVTGANPFTSSSRQGDGFAALLLGWGSSGYYSISPSACAASGYFGTYVQDDWRISRNLTLNLGLRYDFDIPRTDRFDRQDWWDPTLPSPVAGKLSNVPEQFINLKGAYQFVDNSHRSPFVKDLNNIQPRIGIAYALGNKMSIRTGYGVFYTVNRDVIKGDVGWAFAQDSPVQFSRDSGITQYATLENPFPLGLSMPAGRDPLMCLGIGCYASVRKSANPQYQQWNFSVQRELPGQGVLEVNYAGSKGTHLYFGTADILGNYNKLDPMYYSLGRDALEAQVPNPFYGLITNPQSIMSEATVPLQTLLRPYPQYGDGTVGGYLAPPNIGNSIYHSVQFKYEKRFSHGLSVVAHYTISKLITDSDANGSDTEWLGGTTSLQNWKNLRLERSLGSYDVPQLAVLSFDYQLPIGRGRAFGRTMNRVLNGFVGGWELSGIITLSSAMPLQPGLADGTLWDSIQRPNLLSDPCMPGSVRSKLNNYLNPDAFSIPEPDTYGSAPRTLSSCRGPSLKNEDLTMMKNFNFSERKYLQLRLEAYHATNSPQFGGPDTGVGSDTFGMITGAGGARSIQIAVKFYY